MFGQVNPQLPPQNNVPEWAAGTAAIIEAAAQPAVDAYAINQHAEINAQRIKAGLPPLPPPRRRIVGPLPPPQQREGLGLGTIAIIAIILLLLFSGKSG